MAQISSIEINTAPAKKSIADLKKELDNTNKALEQLDVNSVAFADLQKQAASLKGQLDQVNKTTDTLSKGFVGFGENAAKVTAGISGGITAVTASMQLLGVENDNVVKGIAKLQQLMAITQGISNLKDFLEGFKNLATAIKAAIKVKLLDLSTTKQQLAAEKANMVQTNLTTTAIKGQTVATIAATTATKALKVALITTGIGALITIISTLVSKLVEWARENNNTQISQEALNAVIKNTTNSLQTLQDTLKRSQNIENFALSVETTKNALLELDLQLKSTLLSFNALITKKGQNALDLFTQQTTNWNNSVYNLHNQLRELLNTVNTFPDPDNTIFSEFKKIFGSEQGNMATGFFATMQRAYEYLTKISENPLNPISKEASKYLFETLPNTYKYSYQELSNYISTLDRTFLTISNKLSQEQNETVRASLQRQLDQIKNIKEVYSQGLSIIEGVSSANNKQIKDTLTLIALNNQLYTERLKNQVEIQKVQLDWKAQSDENYKNSSQYLKDQLEYHQNLEKTLTKGTAAYVQNRFIIEDLANKYVLSLLKADKQLKEEVYESQEEIDESIKKMLEDWEQLRQTVRDFYNQITDSYLSDELYFYSQQDKKREYLKQSLKQQLMSYEEYSNAVKILDKQEAQFHINQSVIAANYIADILQSAADYQDQNNKEGFEKSKKLQIAAATINTISGITAALSGLFTTKTGPWDIALATLQAASIAAAGAANIAKIQRQQYNSTSSVSASVGASTITPPTQYTQAVNNANLETKLGDNRVVVSVEEINRVQDRVNVQVDENTY